MLTSSHPEEWKGDKKEREWWDERAERGMAEDESSCY